jgi:hypothetical protein
MQGVSILKQPLPVRYMHSELAGVGHTEEVNVTDSEITAIAVVSRQTAEAMEVVASARNGFPWQASVGASVQDYQFVPEGETVQANGRTYTGPLYLVNKSTIYEISIVDLGGDSQTQAQLVAGAASMSDIQKPDTQDTKDVVQASTPAPPQPPPQDNLVAEVERFKAIQAIFGDHVDLAEKAIQEKWPIERCQLEVIRASRPKAPAAHVRSEQIDQHVLTCALRMQARDSRVEKDYKPEALEVADRYRGLTLVKLAELCARLDGIPLQAGARPMEIVQASFSSRSLANILKESASKLLLDGYQSVDPAATRIAKVMEVPDFKTITITRLTGQYKLEKVAPDGEIPHAVVTDQGYTIKIETYGKMVGLTRQDVINDDLGAFLDVPRQIGRGAAIALETAFWSMVEGAGSFFSGGNNNVATSAVFGVAGLNKAIAVLRKQKDEDGNPIRSRPRFVALPPDLEADATAIYTSNVLLIAGSTDRTVAQNNPHANKYEPIVSEFLSGSGSNSTWYLVADPADTPAFGVAFLRGQSTPTIEEADPDPKYLGRLYRGYFDFGVALLDPRGAVKATA